MSACVGLQGPGITYPAGPSVSSEKTNVTVERKALTGGLYALYNTVNSSSQPQATFYSYDLNPYNFQNGKQTSNVTGVPQYSSLPGFNLSGGNSYEFEVNTAFITTKYPLLTRLYFGIDSAPSTNPGPSAADPNNLNSTSLGFMGNVCVVVTFPNSTNSSNTNVISFGINYLPPGQTIQKSYIFQASAIANANYPYGSQCQPCSNPAGYSFYVNLYVDSNGDLNVLFGPSKTIVDANYSSQGTTGSLCDFVNLFNTSIISDFPRKSYNNLYLIGFSDFQTRLQNYGGSNIIPITINSANNKTTPFPVQNITALKNTSIVPTPPPGITKNNGTFEVNCQQSGIQCNNIATCPPCPTSSNCPVCPSESAGGTCSPWSSAFWAVLGFLIIMVVVVASLIGYIFYHKRQMDKASQ